MDFTQNQTVKYTAILLLLAALIQPIYTALYQLAPEVDRQFLWSLEAIIFVLMGALALAALVGAKRFTLGWAAIAFSAGLNVVQVGIGLTQFGPFREAAKADPELGSAAFAIVALSFFLYNAAKILLGLAAIIFGKAKMEEGGKLLGLAAVLAGVVAFVANALVMMFGIQGFFPRPIAGGSGVLATLFLALCLFSLKGDASKT